MYLSSTVQISTDELQEITSWSDAEANQSVTFKTSASTTGATCTNRGIGRATRKTLEAHQANFSLDGLRFHFGKLKQYTNPTGGALDKIPLNDKVHTALFYAQWDAFDVPTTPLDCETVLCNEPAKQRPLFLRKKAQYHVADHLLGIGKKAYWTGSTGKSTTLLGLDIDDHESPNEADVQAHSQQALQLFIELTGLNPVPCKSPRGINAFLICNKGPLTTHGTNETWHSIIRQVNAEANRRGLLAKLECKGKARIFSKERQYCGVQFKDPLYATNPSDDHLHEFWEKLEASPVSGARLHDLLSTLENEAHCTESEEKANAPASPLAASITADELLPVYKGNWAKQCREWAINGLPCHDSMTPVVLHMAKWLYFVELWEINENDRVEQVVNLLTNFCFAKHNGYITRLTNNQEEDVRSHIGRIVKSSIAGTSDQGKAIFAKLQSQRHMKLVPLMQGMSSSFPSFSSVTSIQCCSVLDQQWKPAPEYWRDRAEKWIYEPDDTALPDALDARIRGYYAKRAIGLNKPSLVKIRRFLNHLRANSGEARVGIKSLKKMGFTSDHTRQHIKHLEEMGLIVIGDYSPVAGVSRSFRLIREARDLLLGADDAQVPVTPDTSDTFAM